MEMIRMPKKKGQPTVLVALNDLAAIAGKHECTDMAREIYDLMDKIKDFNYKNIYSCKRILPSRRYFNLVITETYNLLISTYAGSNTLDNLKKLSFTYPKLGNGFIDFIHNYYDFGNRDELKLKNKVLFSIDNEKDFCKAIIYYISGMTDNFAIEIYNEIIHF